MLQAAAAVLGDAALSKTQKLNISAGPWQVEGAHVSCNACQIIFVIVFVQSVQEILGLCVHPIIKLS